jgi:hypothetical protein
MDAPPVFGSSAGQQRFHCSQANAIRNGAIYPMPPREATPAFRPKLLAEQPISPYLHGRIRADLDLGRSRIYK